VDLTRTFTIVLEPEQEGGFTVRVSALPEIVSYGNDEQEALEMAKDAIRLVLEDRAARGEPIPNGEAARIREVTVRLAAPASLREISSTEWPAYRARAASTIVGVGW